MKEPNFEPDTTEIEALEEGVAEFVHEGIVDTISNEMETTEEVEAGLSDKEIKGYEQEAIEEFAEESVGELIEEELRNTDYSEELIEKLKEAGIEKLESQIPTKKVHAPREQNSGKPTKTVGSEGTPKPHNYPTQPEKQKDPSLPRGEKSSYKPTPREMLEARKKGSTEYLENETRRPSNDPDVIKHRKNEEEKTLEQLEEIETELEFLPPDPEEAEIEIEDISDEEAQAQGWKDNHERKHWKEGTLEHAKFLKETSKRQKLNTTKSRLSVGITNKDLGECGSAEKRIVARAHLPSYMLPENRTEPYDIERLEEEIRLAKEEGNLEDLDDEDFESNPEELEH